MAVGKGKKKEAESVNGTPVCPAARAEFIHRVKERLSTLPDVRPERIRRAALRVSQGFYDRPQVVAKIAERFLEEMEFD